jgi:hypothetical protein
MTSTYYWRAVRRIAKRKGISIPAARKKDWQKEANAERKRRSEPHLRQTIKRTPKTSKPRKPAHKPVGITTKRKRRHPAKRVLFPKPKIHIIASGPVRELDEYEEEEAEEPEESESEQIWEEDWQNMYGTLDDMDELDTFLEEFEYQDSDNYQEP